MENWVNTETAEGKKSLHRDHNDKTTYILFKFFFLGHPHEMHISFKWGHLDDNCKIWLWNAMNKL